MRMSASWFSGRCLRVSDLPHDPKWKYLSDSNLPVAHITSVKEEEAPTPEAVAAEAAAAPAEPEVIKKGKQETEEEGAEAAARRESREEGREEREEVTRRRSFVAGCWLAGANGPVRWLWCELGAKS